MVIRLGRGAIAGWLVALALLIGLINPIEAQQASGDSQEPPSPATLGLIERDGLTILAGHIEQVEGRWIARGDVRVVSGPLLALCEVVVFDEAAGRVRFEGRVRLLRGQERLEGQRATLDRLTGVIVIEGARADLRLPARTRKAPARGPKGAGDETASGSY